VFIEINQELHEVNGPQAWYDLLLRGYKNLAVLDVSETAIEVTKDRLGSGAEQVR